jgi:hypothetical protein
MRDTNRRSGVGVVLAGNSGRMPYWASFDAALSMPIRPGAAVPGSGSGKGS